ncbi:MAG: dihydropteroate synthase [Micrococcales bacterium]|nr:dihydropteroate synthase [Micrococcales bacterium]
MLRPAPLPGALAALERPLVMGICNVTPDSFSDAGQSLSLEAAVEHCQAMLDQGADLVDIGGESTRPGAGRVAPSEELGRVIPVIRRLASQGAAISVDTTRAAVAAAAVEAGAIVINDVSGGLADPAMFGVMAATGVVSVLAHWRAPSAQMDACDRYNDAAGEVCAELAARLAAAVAAGVKAEAVVLDPGLGFAKVGHTNWQVLAGWDRLAALGLPLLVGASRKRFLRLPLGFEPQAGPKWDQLDQATATISAMLTKAGVWGLRVHNVPLTRQAIAMAAAMATPPA